MFGVVPELRRWGSGLLVRTNRPCAKLFLVGRPRQSHWTEWSAQMSSTSDNFGSATHVRNGWIASLARLVTPTGDRDRECRPHPGRLHSDYLAGARMAREMRRL